MKSIQIILAGLAMFLLSISLQAEITTTIIDNSIAVSSDKSAVEGYRGCDAVKLEKVPAYVFELQTKKPDKHATCSISLVGKWSTVSRIESTNGSAIFEQLPEGKYRIISLTGFAIGCEIEGDTKGFPGRSIVYEKEVSEIINLGNEPIADSKASTIISSTSHFGVLDVFPNPADEKLNIHLTSSKISSNVTIVLYNLLGQEVIRMEDQAAMTNITNTWEISVAKLISGSYLIRIFDDKGISFQQKIVVE